jgi:hypothetical protein
LWLAPFVGSVTLPAVEPPVPTLLPSSSRSEPSIVHHPLGCATLSLACRLELFPLRWRTYLGFALSFARHDDSPPSRVSYDHDHLDFGYLGIQGLSSTRSAHRSLLQPQHLDPHDALTFDLAVDPPGCATLSLFGSHSVVRVRMLRLE